MILHSLFSPQNNIVQGDSESIIRMALAGMSSSSGISVTPESAMRTAAVYACIKVLSEDVGKLPLPLYRRTRKNGRDGRERATDHPLYGLMNRRPNHLHTPITFRECVTASAAMRGNGISIISRIGSKVAAVTPVHPDRCRIKLNNSGDRIYTIRFDSGTEKDFPQSDILHVMGLTFNGFEGISPITYARETIGLSQATQKHGARTFSNGARMGGILSYPGRFKDPATGGRVADEFDSRTNGENAHKTIVLEEGMKWEKVTMTADDAQYLETRQFEIPEIARFWRMPLHKIGDLTRATFSNIEHQSIEYVVDTLSPWLIRWEQSLNASLLTEKEQNEYYFEFLVDGLLRGDIKSRYEAYSRGILAGFLTRNEVRARENLEWIEGLDEPLTPTNMALGSDPVSEANQKDQDEADRKQANMEIKQELALFSKELNQFLSDRYSNNTNEPPSVVVNVTNQMPDQPAPIITVDNQVNVPEQIPPAINNIMPDQSAPVVNIKLSEQPSPVVNVENIVNIPSGERKVSIKRDAAGNMTGADITE